MCCAFARASLSDVCCACWQDNNEPLPYATFAKLLRYLSSKLGYQQIKCGARSPVACLVGGPFHTGSHPSCSALPYPDSCSARWTKTAPG